MVRRTRRLGKLSVSLPAGFLAAAVGGEQSSEGGRGDGLRPPQGAVEEAAGGGGGVSRSCGPAEPSSTPTGV